MFSLKTIQALIEFNWKLTAEAVNKQLFYPYLAYLIFFWFYTTFDYEISYSEWYSDNYPTAILSEVMGSDQYHSSQIAHFVIAIMLRVIIMLFTGYFLYIEVI